MQDIIANYLNAETLAIIFAAAWAVSEALSLIPSVKSNGVFQLFVNLLGAVGRRMGWIASALMVITLAGCTTLNVSLNTSNGESSKGGAIKTDAQADQNISPTTSASIPVR